MQVNDNSYVNIQAFMVNDLHLSGNELIIFAVIYGFSQDGFSWFSGSRSYLSAWCQASKNTVSSNLAKLCEKGLIEKRTRVENGVTFNDYRVVQNLVGVYKKLVGGVQETCTGGVQETCPHTIEEGNTRENKKKDMGKPARFVPPTVEQVAKYCKERGNDVDPQRFVDYYEARGWKTGNNKVSNWQACVRTWERNGYNSKPKQNAYVPQDTSTPTVEEIMAEHGVSREDAEAYLETFYGKGSK